MPSGSRLLCVPASKALIDSSVAHTNTPELPPGLRCFHSTTNSKFAIGSLSRITPVGLPVQLITPSLNDQVSLSQLTLTKSASPSDFQPGPTPLMKALGGDAGSSA